MLITIVAKTQRNIENTSPFFIFVVGGRGWISGGQYI
jgi:hypothetical protein